MPLRGTSVTLNVMRQLAFRRGPSILLSQFIEHRPLITATGTMNHHTGGEMRCSRHKLGLFLSILLVTNGCATHRSSNRNSPGPLAAAASSWEDAIEQKDPAAIAQAFTEDAVAMYPHPMPTVGRENNRRAWERVYSNPVVEHPVTVDSVQTAASGDLGYTFGRWWYRNPEQKVNSGGRYLAVWRRDGETWRITMLSANRHADIAADTLTR